MSADIDNIQFRAKYQLENISEPYVCTYTRIATQKNQENAKWSQNRQIQMKSQRLGV